ncbi:hypothetical protein SERLADRAFT_479987 [Serpula lacrymans var. lacrymans S7.9]|nr:uncharacterized protein SERLADRAFT_479987 [Serpula lacrymans var. lacrymans S7.9]EGO18924.1 hypothetical protein SERLADRAFT_479987 [Serpula lacrymans var. lacrymans S7.9]
MRELEEEQKLVEEIENSDQDYLNELKATLAEQSAELEAFRVDVDESNAKLQRLREKSDEINSQKQETTSEIASLQRFIHVQKSSTRFEVYRLKDELEAMQDLHKWRITKVHSDLLEVIYTSTYRVSIPCAKHQPLLEAVKIEPVESSMTSTKHSFPALNALMLRTAQQLVSTLGEGCNVRKIVEFLGDYWSSCSQLLLQLKLMALKYPVSVKIAPSEPSNSAGFTAIASVMIPKVKAKALISFTLDTKTISRWPLSVGSVQCDVTVAYGPIQRDPILKAVLDRLGQANPGNNHACLLEACTEAMDQIS